MKRSLSIVVLGLVCLASCVAVAGCRASRVQAHIDQMTPRLEAAIHNLQKAEEIVTDLVARSREGEVIVEQWRATLSQVFSPDMLSRFDELLARGASAGEAAVTVLQQMRGSAQIMLDQYRGLNEQLAAAQADDDVTREVLLAGVSGLAGLLGVGGPVAAIIGAIQKRRGAVEMVGHVDALRGASPTLDAAFAGLDPNTKLVAWSCTGRTAKRVLSDAGKKLA